MRERESLFLTECFNIGSPPVTTGCNAFMSPTLKNGGHEPVLHAESQDCLRKYRQCRRFDSRRESASSFGRSESCPEFKQFPAAKCFPANARGLASSIIGNGNRPDIPVDRTRRPEERNPHGFANSDWPYKCYLAMSEPIADRAVRLMKDEDLWR
jgi:hypothetical protein